VRDTTNAFNSPLAFDEQPPSAGESRASHRHGVAIKPLIQYRAMGAAPDSSDCLPSPRKSRSPLGMRLEIVLIALLALIALGRGISDAPLIDWDEATYSQVVREAIARGNYLDFTWNGDAYLKKPPLLFWAMAASIKAFGECELAARLPSVLFGTATVILMYFAAAPVAGRLAATIAAVIPFSFYFFVARGGRECATDAPLIFFSALAILAFDRSRRSRAWLSVAGLACGLALLSKGLAGAIPFLVLGTAVAAVPAYRSLGVSSLLAVGGVASAVAAPWYLFQILHHRDLFLSVFIGHETLARVARHVGGTPRENSATLTTFFSEVGMLWPIVIPFALMVPRSVRGGLRSALTGVHPTVALWCIWLAIALAAAMAVQTKLPWYVLPSLIPTALISGSVLGRALSSFARAERYVFASGCAALALLAFQVPHRWRMIEASTQFQRERSTPAMNIAIRARSVASERSGGRLLFAGPQLPTLVYYSGMRCDWIQAPKPHGSEIDSDAQPPFEAAQYDLVLIDQLGDALTVANLGDEWNLSGPGGLDRLRPTAARKAEVDDATPPLENGGTE
jgi:4-amino-4-deoxy-L-arabinose transferase-like glycosyltransferase